MSQTSDNSRTFRIINLTDDVKTSLASLNAVVTQHENINYVEVSAVSDIQAVKSALDGAEMKYKQCSYSTFVRFKDNMTVEQLNQFATSLCKDVNILYSLVDENNHTGKLVVDRLIDYNSLKSNTGDVSFYRFSPLNVSQGQSRGSPRNNNTQTNNTDGEWQVQAPLRRQTVQGRYTQVAQDSAPRTQTRGPSTRGRGGATRGRGGARSAPASS
jgi:hypothetical protein